MNIRNIARLYSLNFFSNLTFGVVVWMLYLQVNGLSLFQVTLLQAVLNFGMLLFEIPTGVFADHKGPKLSLIIGIGLLIIQGIFLLIFPTLFSMQLIGFFLAGLGYALLSGTKESMLYESLSNTAETQDKTKIIGRFSSFGNWALVIGLLGGGLMNQISGRLVFSAVVAALMIALIVSLGIEPVTKSRPDTGRCRHFIDLAIVIRHQRSNFPLFLCFAAVISVVSLFYIFGQEIFDEVLLPTYVIGAVFALTHGLAGLAGLVAHKLESFLGEDTLFISSFFVMGLLFAGLLLQTILVHLVVFILINFFFGVIDPVLTRVINEKFSSKHRTALNSTFNFLSSMLMFIIGPLQGWWVTHTQSRLGIITGIIGAVMTFLSVLMFRFHVRRVQKSLG